MQKVLDNIENIVEEGGQFRMIVTGFSMLPLLGYGHDHIIVRRTDLSEPILGRIAMFRTPNRRIIVHRVIAIDGDKVTFHGDGNLAQIEECSRKDVIGVVDTVIRQNGKEVSCTTRWWHIRERIWLAQPMIIRRYALAIMRRWLNFKKRR